MRRVTRSSQALALLSTLPVVPVVVPRIRSRSQQLALLRVDDAPNDDGAEKITRMMEQEQSTTPKRRKAALQSAQPAGWRATYALIEELRADRSAVVDSMGTEAIAGASSKQERDFHALVSLMLSS